MINIQNKISQIRNLPEDFFNPDISNVNNPELLKNINDGSELFYQYLLDKTKKITIYADIDLDGITSSSIMYQWIKKYHNKTKINISQRNEGHGVKSDKLFSTDLLIIIDSSSNECDEAHKIINNGIAKDILIIDHHPTDGNINNINNVILINQQQPNDGYPNKELSGAMLTIKFLEFIENKYNMKSYVNNFLDLGAISIISDVMSVLNMENRYYYYTGMNVIKNIGIANLLHKMHVNCCHVSSQDIGFKLNKALNSKLRLQDINSNFKLIIDYNENNDNDKIVDNILDSIKLREQIEKEIIDSLSTIIDTDGVLIVQNNYKKNINILNNFNGVIASKLTDIHNKNVLVVNESLKGSGRSYNNYNFKSYINKSNYAKAQGHEGAFGVTISNIQALEDYFNNNIPVFDKIKDYEIELSLKDISKKTFDEVNELQYLIGKDFNKIKFKINNILINEIKQTSGLRTYYNTIKPKSYIRFINNSGNNDIKKGQICNLYGYIEKHNYFGKDYYEVNCYNIDIIDNGEDNDWGF